MSTSTPARRTGGRSAAVIHGVHAAVEDLIQEKCGERVTVPMIAERAGVNPTSIYRRWGNLPTLLNDIAAYHLNPDRPMVTRGDLRKDLISWAEGIRTHFQKPLNAALLRGGVATSGERTSDCLRTRRAEAEQLLARHPVSSVTVSDVMDVVIAPIITRVLFEPWTLGDASVDDIVSRLFRSDEAAVEAGGGPRHMP
ncbi:TetR/AcrR family transcriptional regulator [Leifsonia shinshuensis]|uniref:TetR/AcrR family transcriptional regulator n=1 Tax=Leifsonia shinshuensis TaxID=150026 RepID=UPI002856B8A1|nr:TetR/AcrR family transcriptional regulator [Leifsonia shinshuensis]MDR6972889.1 AcrR family transcriptional regulator [Leifsonia shinshuensis]